MDQTLPENFKRAWLATLIIFGSHLVPGHQYTRYQLRYTEQSGIDQPVWDLLIDAISEVEIKI